MLLVSLLAGVLVPVVRASATCTFVLPSSTSEQISNTPANGNSASKVRCMAYSVLSMFPCSVRAQWCSSNASCCQGVWVVYTPFATVFTTTTDGKAKRVDPGHYVCVPSSGRPKGLLLFVPGLAATDYTLFAEAAASTGLAVVVVSSEQCSMQCCSSQSTLNCTATDPASVKAVGECWYGTSLLHCVLYVYAHRHLLYMYCGDCGGLYGCLLCGPRKRLATNTNAAAVPTALPARERATEGATSLHFYFSRSRVQV